MYTYTYRYVTIVITEEEAINLRVGGHGAVVRRDLRDGLEKGKGESDAIIF